MNPTTSTIARPLPASFGSYEFVQALGSGGMGTVYLGRRTEAGKTQSVAIKRLHDFIADDPANAVLLRDEARLAASVRHPNIVRVVDMIDGTSSTGPTLVMEWIDGADLATLSRTAAAVGQRLPLDVVVAIVRDVLAGLHAAHEATQADGVPLQIVHRDVSPQNILVGVDGVARLTDFGLAKAAWRLQASEPGTIKGKLGYMAPEQLDGRCDRRADVYSAGVVLWELLTGARLRDSNGSWATVLVQILHGTVVPPSELEADAAPLEDLVLQALSRYPEDRFETTLEMLESLVARVTPASSERVADVVALIASRGRALSALPANAASEAVTILDARAVRRPPRRARTRMASRDGGRRAPRRNSGPAKRGLQQPPGTPPNHVDLLTQIDRLDFDEACRDRMLTRFGGELVTVL